MRIKRIISAFLATTMMLTSIAVAPLSANASNDTGSLSLMVRSDSVPESAVDYAKAYFSGITYDYLYQLGFAYDECNDLRLSSGFTPYEYDECDAPLYYFPVVNDNNIIAMLKVIDFGNGNYSVQFGKSELADSLNALAKCDVSQITLVISDEAMYSINEDDEINKMEQYIFNNESVASYRMSTNRVDESSLDISYDSISFDNEKVVEISDNTIANMGVSARVAPVAVSLNVPFVTNRPTAEYPVGICWAAAAASVIKFRLGSHTTKTAETIAAEIISKGYDSSMSVITDNMKTAIKNYIDGTITKKGTLTYSSIKSRINDSKPIWSLWELSGGNGHCLVIRGYETRSDGTQHITFMDCNLKYYTGMPYGTAFSSGTTIYTWQESLY